MGLFGSSDNSNKSDHKQRSAEHLAENSKGDISKKSLTQTGGILFNNLYDGPIIEKLNQDEQPEYLFDPGNTVCGLLISPNGTTKNKGKTYLLITDERLLQITGGSKKEGDTVCQIAYEDLIDIKLLDGESEVARWVERDSPWKPSQIPWLDKSSNSVNEESYILIDGMIRNEALSEAIGRNRGQDVYGISGRNDVYEAKEYVSDKISKFSTEGNKTGPVADSNQQVNTQKPNFQQKISSIRSDLTQIDSLIENTEWENSKKRLEDVEIQIDSLAEEYTGHETLETIIELGGLVEQRRQEIEQQRQQNGSQEEMNSIRSDLLEVDSLVSDNNLQEAQKRIDNIESSVNSVVNMSSGKIQANKIDKLRESVDEKRNEIEQKIRMQEREAEFQEEIHSIRSNLAEVDSLATDAEFKQASLSLDEIESRITELRQESSRVGFGTLETDIQQLKKDCSNRLSKHRVLNQLRGMDPYNFEELVAKIWKKQGWETKTTSGSADRGVDVVATKADTFEKRRHLIQVKRHGENSTVGSEDIQRYASLYQRDEQVDNVFVVTSNRFTSEAKEVANRRNVSTVNGDKLYEMLTKT